MASSCCSQICRAGEGDRRGGLTFLAMVEGTFALLHFIGIFGGAWDVIKRRADDESDRFLYYHTLEPIEFFTTVRI